MDCQGKVALVTGAARRVGRAVALELARAGCDVALHYHRSEPQARELVNLVTGLGRRAAAFQADLGEPEAPQRLVAQVRQVMGGPDVLVNNASLFEPTPLEPGSQADWAAAFQVNAIAPALLAAAAAPGMKAAGGGRIVNLVDILAERPIRRYPAYCASKAALASLTRSLALELAPEINVNGIAPGIAVFPEAYDAGLRARLVGRVPLRREGTPEGIASLVRYLVTEGDYITGQIIAVDGGWSIA